MQIRNPAVALSVATVWTKATLPLEDTKNSEVLRCLIVELERSERKRERQGNKSRKRELH
jgi:hypothetical protein